ncbi:phenylacetaldehyde reductase isoform X2 [Arachis hypogaea]|uniref:phenylacetaldehyde reductase isoform X2 n=1 Tax=Arachis hypogaea TaxID=3818 RepID=UPI000DECA3CF|nr:cinnamoyl-CoA reductase 1 isoform X2 [Arachis hypogaea]
MSLMLVKHVILTSSIAAVTFNGRLLTPKAVVDDTWFFDHELCKESKSWYWYVLSKTLAEDAAWKFAKKKKKINPVMVIGPLLQPVRNTSAAGVLNVTNGEEALFQ